MPSIKLLLSVVLLSFVFAGCEGGYSWQVAPIPILILRRMLSNSGKTAVFISLPEHMFISLSLA